MISALLIFNVIKDFMLLLLMGLMGILLIGLSIFELFSEYRKMIKILKSNGIYDEAVDDFSTAQPFMDDRIRLGDKYIFGKHYCTILRYTDISRVYQYIYIGKSIAQRELHAVDTFGHIWVLCKLGDDRLLDVLDFMLYKNPQIAIGYE